MDVDPSGTTFVIRTDTYGAYVSNGSDDWQQLYAGDRLPTGVLTQWMANDAPNLAYGCYAIAVSASNSNRIYMNLASESWDNGATVHAIWRSDNRGTNWTQAGSGYPLDGGGVDPNDSLGSRWHNQKMAVDPANPDVVYAGSGTNLYVTTNGGSSWSVVSGVPAPTSAVGSFAAYTGICFDPSSGTTSGRTNIVYCVSNGNGVYKSDQRVNGGDWALCGSGGPVHAVSGAVATDGWYYLTTMAESPAVLSRWNGSAWSTTSGVDTWQGRLTHVATDPFNAQRILATDDAGALAVSNDRGANWLIQPDSPYGGSNSWRGHSFTSGDMPWFQNANGVDGESAYFSVGFIKFDPTVEDKIWMGHGIGVWYSTEWITNSYNDGGIIWVPRSRGIEQLVAVDVTCPPGSSYVLTSNSDRGGWAVPRVNTEFPTRYINVNSNANLICGQAIAYSRAAPLTDWVIHCNSLYAGEPAVSGYTTDSGATWAQFSAQPAGGNGSSGDIIAASIDNIICIVGNQGVYRSTNRGSSWSSVFASIHNGIAQQHAKLVAVDGGDNGILYLFSAANGIYRSTDGGATWGLVTTNAAGGWSGFTLNWVPKIRTVPGYLGHVYFCAGQQGGIGNDNPTLGAYFWRSTNANSGTPTWSAITAVEEVYDVAFGAPASGQSYPAIYVAGWRNGFWGIWRSVDNAATWASVSGNAPPGYRCDQLNNIAASMDTYGEVYAAFQGSGWLKRNGD